VNFRLSANWRIASRDEHSGAQNVYSVWLEIRDVGNAVIMIRKQKKGNRLRLDTQHIPQHFFDSPQATR
jgi:hypothetical protein